MQPYVLLQYFYSLLQEYVFRLQITMYESRLAQQAQPIEQLLRKNSHQRRAQNSELVLLDQLVQIDTEQLEHETQMLPVDEGVFE